MKQKRRLDVLLSEQYPQYSRQQVQSWIMQGKVMINGHVVTKPGMHLSGDSVQIELDIQEPRYVSRAGLKLEHALNVFHVDVSDMVVLDAGISTGGFTDCLLQHGAQKVYGIDVGYGQVHEKIRTDPRVIIMERTNLRLVKTLPELVDLATIDLSFISVLKVMPVLVNLLKPAAHMIVLIKPQFEAARHEVGRKGIIKDPMLHQRIVNDVVKGIEKFGFACVGLTESPITGSSGNKEFLAFFKRITR